VKDKRQKRRKGLESTHKPSYPNHLDESDRYGAKNTVEQPGKRLKESKEAKVSKPPGMRLSRGN
jgi:hypothetical protein